MSKNFDIIIREAKDLSLEVEMLHEDKEIAAIRNVGKEYIVQELFCLHEDRDSEGVKLAKDKWVTRLLWEKCGIPMPKTLCFDDPESALAGVNDIEPLFPVAIKERYGSKSRNIHMDISSTKELPDIFREVGGGIVIQEMVRGHEYRVLICDGRVLGVLEMIPPRVFGDGRKNVIELIEEKNLLGKRKVRVNPGLSALLRRANLSYDSVPTADKAVYLKDHSCLAEGGETIDRTDDIHPDIARLAAKAVGAVKLRLGGIDLICEDISKSPDEQKIAFLEVNGHPSIDIHYEPTMGEARRVAREILLNIFELNRL